MKKRSILRRVIPWVLLAAVLGACCLVKLLNCLFRHSVAILAGGVIMLLIIRTLHNLTK